MFDFTMGEERTLEASWAYRHWYGSGATIVLMDIYPSAEAAVSDDFSVVMRRKMETMSEEEKEEMGENFREWWAFFDGHWDEMRAYNPETDFVGKADVDWISHLYLSLEVIIQQGICAKWEKPTWTGKRDQMWKMVYN